MTNFSDSIFTAAGFYVIGYKNGQEVFCFCDAPINRGENRFSFARTTKNTRDENGCHDFLLYEWVNYCSFGEWNPAVSWRKQTEDEAASTMADLYQFSRQKKAK